MSPRLNRHLPGALGLDGSNCYIVRNAGGTVTPHDNSILRSVLLGVASGNVKTVIVLGHPRCSAQSSMMDLTNRLTAAGVQRSALHDDLHGWFGLIGSPESNVRSVVQAVSTYPAIPSGVIVLGMMIDEETGRVTNVCSSSTSGLSVTSAPGAQSMGPVKWDRGEIGKGTEGPKFPSSPSKRHPAPPRHQPPTQGADDLSLHEVTPSEEYELPPSQAPAKKPTPPPVPSPLRQAYRQAYGDAKPGKETPQRKPQGFLTDKNKKGQP